MATLVTGAAGFIGAHTCRALLARGDSVVGLDNLNSYYAPQLKHDRLQSLLMAYREQFSFIKVDLANGETVRRITDHHCVDTIVHLGAQAGVRHSIDNPASYIQSNLVGHANILELARQADVRHLVYASSSSVYGDTRSTSFSVSDRADQPASLYAATKRSNELLSESYASLYRLAQTGLRFFTVYGPWGRPDMAPWIFTRNILDGIPIDVFNHGRLRRDFTYIDDIVAGILKALDTPPADDQTVKPGGYTTPHRLYNLGNNSPVDLLHFISVIEAAAGREAIMNLLPMQPGDVHETCADITESTRDLSYSPVTNIETGMGKFVDWYRSYNRGSKT